MLEESSTKCEIKRFFCKNKVFWYFCHVWILCGITLGILNIVFQKYDAYT